jgi:hypothetical protein
VSRGQGWGLGVAAAFAGAATVFDRRVLLVLGGAALVVTVLQLFRGEPDPASRWRRGWGLVALAAMPAAGSLWSPLGDPLRPALLILTGVLILAGLAGALPTREPARVRELALEAALAGGS